jgi:hypothetical protein
LIEIDRTRVTAAGATRKEESTMRGIGVFTRAVGSFCVLTFVLGALAASSAHAALIRYDLRAVQDGTIGAAVHDPKNVHVTSPEGIVNMQVWAMVPNLNGTNDDDQFVMTQLSFLSTSGNLRGDLLATCIPFFTYADRPEPGQQLDLDDDGDLDVGDNRLTTTNDSPWPWFMAYGNWRQWSVIPETLKASEIQADQAYSSFLIGSLNFSFDNLSPGLDLATAINIRPRVKTDGRIVSQRVNIFVEDGTRYGLQSVDPGVITGAPVNVTTTPTHMPEPATWLLAAIGATALLAYRRRCVAAIAQRAIE